MKRHSKFLIVSALFIIASLLIFSSCEKEDTIVEVPEQMTQDQILAQLPETLEVEGVSTQNKLMTKSLFTSGDICILVGKYVINTGNNYQYNGGDPIFMIVYAINMSPFDASNVVMVESTYFESVNSIGELNLINPDATAPYYYEDRFWNIPNIPAGGISLQQITVTAPVDTISHIASLYSLTNFLNSDQFELGRINGDACLNNDARVSVSVRN